MREGARFGFLNRLPDMTGAQAALAYVLANRNVASAVVGYDAHGAPAPKTLRRRASSSARTTLAAIRAATDVRAAFEGDSRPRPESWC